MYQLEKLILHCTVMTGMIPGSEEAPCIEWNSDTFDIKGKASSLVDDVLFTGRTVRAALDALWISIDHKELV